LCRRRFTRSEPSLFGSDGIIPKALEESGAVSGRRREGPENTPRLRLKRKSPTTGYVDGAWWPHSDDLGDELPDLLTVLSVRLGAVARVLYNYDEWPTTPRKIVVNDRVVRLDGYRRQPAHTIGVLDDRGHKINLLVVPPKTEADRAHTISMAAAAPDDASSVSTLLANSR
jgi:hypothetical protein